MRDRMRASELRRLAEGREAEIFEWEDGVVLRLMRDRVDRSVVESEASALRAAAAAGVRVPAPLGSVEIEGRPGLLMERIDGTDLLTHIGRRPWSLASIGALCGRLHAELHRVEAPAGLPDLRDAMRARLESPLVPAEIRSFARERLEGLPDGDRLCHGDFHPGNVLGARAEWVIIDWTAATRGDPEADRARTRLMVRMGELPPGSPILVQVLAKLGRRALLAAYDRGYRGARASVDRERATRWEVPVAAARLVDDVESERPGLLEFLRRRMRA